MSVRDRSRTIQLQPSVVSRFGAALGIAAMMTSPLTAQQASEANQSEYLEDRTDAVSFFQELTQEQNRQNADLLAEIDEIYRKAVRELSAENIDRLNALVEGQRTALAKLRELDLSADERSRRTQQIQAELDGARAELAEWFALESERVRNEYSLGRNTQRSLHTALIERVQTEQRRVLSDIRNGPIDVEAVLAAIGLSEEESKQGSGMLPRRPEDPRPALESPATDLPAAARPTVDPAKIDPTVDAKINTQVAPKQFEIAVYTIDNIMLTDARLLGNELVGETLTLDVSIANQGNTEWNSDGNRVEIRFAEGYHDYSQTDLVQVLAGRNYYDAEGTYDFSMPVATGLQLPILIKGRERIRSAIVPVPNPFPTFRRPWRLRRYAIRSGTGPVFITPDIWYTVDVRLYPTEDSDQTLTDNGAFYHFKMKRNGSIVEQDELVFYKPGPPRLVDQ